MPQKSKRPSKPSATSKPVVKPVAKKKSGKPKLDRPFEAATLKKARALVKRYRLVIEPNDDVGFIGCTAEMPFVMADAEDIAGCVAATREATIAAVATMLEADQRPPSPASDGRRETQLNVRLTVDEKQALDAAAMRLGFRSVSDFVRTAALEKAH